MAQPRHHLGARDKLVHVTEAIAALENPTQDMLVQATGYSASAVYRILHILIDAGWIIFERQTKTYLISSVFTHRLMLTQKLPQRVERLAPLISKVRASKEADLDVYHGYGAAALTLSASSDSNAMMGGTTTLSPNARKILQAAGKSVPLFARAVVDDGLSELFAQITPRKERVLLHLRAIPKRKTGRDIVEKWAHRVVATLQDEV